MTLPGVPFHIQFGLDIIMYDRPWTTGTIFAQLLSKYCVNQSTDNVTVTNVWKPSLVWIFGTTTALYYSKTSIMYLKQIKIIYTKPSLYIPTVWSTGMLHAFLALNQTFKGYNSLLYAQKLIYCLCMIRQTWIVVIYMKMSYSDTIFGGELVS